MFKEKLRKEDVIGNTKQGNSEKTLYLYHK